MMWKPNYFRSIRLLCVWKLVRIIVTTIIVCPSIVSCQLYRIICLRHNSTTKTITTLCFIKSRFVILLIILFLCMKNSNVNFRFQPKSLKNEIKDQHRVYNVLCLLPKYHKIPQNSIFLHKLSSAGLSRLCQSPFDGSISWKQTFIRNREIFYL